MTIPPTVSQLIEGSGNSFHSRVARWLLANKWHVTVSPYYLDHAQSKARELDLVAEKLWPIRSDYFNRPQGTVLVRLFVECKYVASETVFWFADKNRAEALKLVCSFSPFRSDNTYTEKHHYLTRSAKVAKLFASSGGRTQENDPFYKALNQTLGATVAMKGNTSAHPDMKKRNTAGKLVTLEYPVIVCSSFDQLYAVDFLSDPSPRRIEDNFQLEVQYAFVDRHDRNRDEYFLIDMVEFEKLQELENAIVEGVNAAATLASY